METLQNIPPENSLSTSDQSRELDKKTIDEFGIDGFTLMEVAALKASRFIAGKEGRSRSGLFICGKGNNGGDALAAARYLCEHAGHSVTLFMALGETDLSEDAARNLKLLKKLQENGGTVSFADQVNQAVLTWFDYIVDGMLGTGLTSDVRDPLPRLIEEINSTSAAVYSMDVPTGLNTDTGQIQGKAIRADYTLTFGTNKLGFYLNDGPNQTGKIHLFELPFPNYLKSSSATLIDKSLIESQPEISRKAKHKYDSGVVHIIAGSEGLTGAAIMAAKSAWKEGAGAVILHTPRKTLPIYESTLPQIIKKAVGSFEDSHFKPEHAGEISRALKEKPGVLLTGPGLGSAPETGVFLKQILSDFDGSSLIDADALSFWKQFASIRESKKQKWLLTPHIGEAKNYLEGKFSDDFERLQWAKDFVNNHHCSLLTKGNPTLFINSTRQVFITGYDTTPFSRAGFGDVLSGSIAARMAVTGEETLSTINALYRGFKTSKNIHDGDKFGPEHLL